MNTASSTCHRLPPTDRCKRFSSLQARPRRSPPRHGSYRAARNRPTKGPSRSHLKLEAAWRLLLGRVVRLVGRLEHRHAALMGVERWRVALDRGLLLGWLDDALR